MGPSGWRGSNDPMRILIRSGDLAACLVGETFRSLVQGLLRVGALGEHLDLGINHGFQRLRVVSGEVELGGLVLELLDEHLVDVLIVEELVSGVFRSSLMNGR